jgi:hypothetical protein
MITAPAIGRRRSVMAGKCPSGCAAFTEAASVSFVLYDFRYSFATRAAETGMPMATLTAIVWHAD